MNKFRLLRADEIECRVASVSEKGLSLLLYKTARTDANLLDETVGSENWENDFKVVDGVLYGGIGIWDDTRNDFIWKWDAGTESNTEAEKGRASDAFKRAGFKCGIGRELYTSPFIWITPDKCNIEERKGRKVCYDRFRVVEIEYNEKCDISRLVIANDDKNGTDVFVFPHKTPYFARNDQVGKDTAESKKTQQSENKPQYRCEACKKPIVEVIGKDGKPMNLSSYEMRVRKRYGGMLLCPDCAKQYDANNGK